MKRKELNEARTKETSNLKKEADSLRIKIVSSESQTKGKKEKNLKKVKNLKKDLSQILTLIREKELMESESEK